MRHGRAFFSVLLLLTAALAGCASAPDTAATGASATRTSPPPRPRSSQEPAWISLERTRTDSGAAPGPVYVVTVFEDGKVIFEGHASVKSKGTFTKNIPPATAAALLSELETLNLWERERRYDVERVNRAGDSVIVRTASSEVPWDIIRARNRSRILRIDGLFFAPSDILRFKEHVEQAVGLAAWIGEPHEWKK